MKLEPGPPNFIFPQVTSWFLYLYFWRLFGLGSIARGTFKVMFPCKFQNTFNLVVLLRIWGNGSKKRQRSSPTLASSQKTSYKFMQMNTAETTYLPSGRLVVGFFTWVCTFENFFPPSPGGARIQHDLRTFPAQKPPLDHGEVIMVPVSGQVTTTYLDNPHKRDNSPAKSCKTSLFCFTPRLRTQLYFPINASRMYIQLRSFISLFGKQDQKGNDVFQLCTKLREKPELSNHLDFSVWQIIKLRLRNWPIQIPRLKGVVLMQPKQLEEQGSPLNLNHIQSVFTLLTLASWGVCTPRTWAPGQETRKVVDSTFLICISTSSTGNLWGRSSFPKRALGA